MNRILITGGNGYIAKTLVKNLGTKYSIYAVSRKDFDLEDYFATQKWFQGKHFDLVIHTASAGTRNPRDSNPEILNKNIMMFVNLLAVKGSYKKLINLCSGASIFLPETPYGASKKITASLASKYDWIYTLRIFGLFDENERPDRFIKGNILRYIRHQPILVYENKIMDFFYSKDLASMIEYCIRDDNAPRLIDCSYVIQPSLLDMAIFINSLGSHSVPINFSGNNVKDYKGNSWLPINTIGLFLGIEMTYEQLRRKTI